MPKMSCLGCLFVEEIHEVSLCIHEDFGSIKCSNLLNLKSFLNWFIQLTLIVKSTVLARFIWCISASTIFNVYIMSKDRLIKTNPKTWQICSLVVLQAHRQNEVNSPLSRKNNSAKTNFLSGLFAVFFGPHVLWIRFVQILESVARFVTLPLVVGVCLHCTRCRSSFSRHHAEASKLS